VELDVENEKGFWIIRLTGGREFAGQSHQFTGIGQRSADGGESCCLRFDGSSKLRQGTQLRDPGR
jgi:hypothetical protein